MGVAYQQPTVDKGQRSVRVDVVVRDRIIVIVAIQVQLGCRLLERIGRIGNIHHVERADVVRTARIPRQNIELRAIGHGIENVVVNAGWDVNSRRFRIGGIGQVDNLDLRSIVVVIFQRQQMLPGDYHFMHRPVGRVGPNARRSHRIGDVNQLDPPVGHGAGDGAGQGDLVQTVGFAVLAHNDWIEAIRGVDHAELDSRDVAQRADRRQRARPTPPAKIHRTDGSRVSRIGNVDDKMAGLVIRRSHVRIHDDEL